MTANEIRAIRFCGQEPETADVVSMLQEIAAQLAELNQKLSDVVDPSAGESFSGVIRVRIHDQA